jgi:tetratricopeptide (TPR) repeat protein
LLVAAVLGLGAGTVLLGRTNRLVQEQRDEARQQRDRARENFRMAREAVDTYLTQVSEEQLLEEPGMQPLREKLLKSALAYYQTFVEQHGDDAGLRRELANARLRWGGITGEIGSREEAKATVKQAIDVFEELHRADPDDLEARRGLARACHLLLYYQAFTGEQVAAEQTGQQATELLTKLHEDYPHVSEYGRLLGRSFDLLAVNRGAHGREKESIPFGRRATQVLEETVQESPGDVEARRLLALAYNNLSVCYNTLGQDAECRQAQGQAVSAYRQLVQADPRSARFRGDLALSLRNAGETHLENDRFALAEPPLQEAVGLLGKLVEENPSVTLHKGRQLSTLYLLGLVLGAEGKTARAVRVLRQSIAVGVSLQERNLLADNYLDFSKAHHQLGAVPADQGQQAEGIRECEQAQRPLEPVVQKNDVDPEVRAEFLEARDDLDRLQLAAGRVTVSEGLAALARTLREYEEIVDQHSNNAYVVARLAQLEYRLADLHLQAGDLPSASAALQRVFDTLDGAVRAHPQNLRLQRHQAAAEALRARIEERQGKSGAAREAARQAVARAEKLAAEEVACSYDLACHRALLSSLLGPGDAEAERQAAAAVDALRKAVAGGHDNVYALKNDARLAPLRTHGGFQEVLQQAEANRREGKE